MTKNDQEKLAEVGGYEQLRSEYEFVVKQWTQYYKMYMQSWSIIGAGMVVAFISFAGKDKGDENDFLQGMVFAMMPVFFLIWILMTSFFWAYFGSYRECAIELEKKMAELSKGERAFVPDYYSKYEAKRIGGFWNGIVLFLFGLLAFTIYFLPAWRGSDFLAEEFGVDKAIPRCLYFLAAGFSAISIWNFMGKKRS